MDLGKGFPIPWEKGAIQIGNNWTPSTPDKPVSQRSNNAQSEMQQNQTGKEDWSDLLGIYTGVLQNEVPNVLPQKFNLHSLVGPNTREQNFQGVAQVQTNNRLQHIIQEVAPVQTNNRLQYNFQDPTRMVRLQQSRDIAPVNTYGMLPQDFGVNSLENRNIQDISTLHMFGQLNANRGNTGSYMQISGEVPHQKVDSLAELMGMMKDASRASPTNGSTYHVGNPTISCQHSQVESDRVAYASFGAILQQDHALCASYDGGGYNLQQMPNGKCSVPNLNLPASSEFGESASSSRPFLLGPVTPDQQKRSNTNQIIQVPDLLIDETSTREKLMLDNVVLSPQAEIIEKEHNEIVLNTEGTSTAIASNSTKENTICQGGDGGIDQNKTPQQKTPKRRKHRPKVVVEKKPKRTPKSAATKTDSPAKRKYVRKSGIKTSENQSTDAVNVVETSNSEPAAKSCKRKLNFELGNGTEKENGAIDYQAHINEGNKRPFNLNLDSRDAELYKVLNEPLTSAAKGGQQNTCEKERQQTQPAYSSAHSVNKLPALESMPLATTASPPTSKDRTLNVIARSLSLRNASTNPNVDGHNQVQHPVGGGLAQLVIRANTSKPDLDSRRQSAVGYMPPQRLGNPVGVMENNHSEMRHPHAITLMGSQLWFHGVPWTGHCNGQRVNIRQNGSEMGNTKKVEDMFHGTSSSTPSDITTIDPLGHIESWRNKSFPTQSYAVNQNGEVTDSGGTGQSISRNRNDRCNMDAYDCYTNFRNKFQQHHASSAQLRLCSERTAPNTSNNSARVQTTNPLTAITNCNLESTSKRSPKSTSVHEITNSPDRVAVKRRNVRQTPSKRILQKESKMSRSYGHSSNKVTGLQEEERRIFSVDYITDLMRDLQINNNGKKIAWKEQNALVPYRGEGAIVPFDLVKKRRPRPRVDLDPETNRVWNLLMLKEGGESSEPMDADKQKWWEEERKVFRGRVDSFIARMHLVQGDRRFSKWKGSVVDSVIGVFLTQNVSDHLSSSAFMSLAAKFPLKSTSARQTSCGDGANPVEHHDVRITFPDETTGDQKIIKEPVYSHSSVTSIESPECRVGNVKTGTRTFSINDQNKRTEEDIISSQSSSESFFFQASEDIRSSSGSNSEAEEGWHFTKTLGYVTAVEQAERIASMQQDQFGIMGSSFPNKRPLIDHQPIENAMYRQNPGPANGLEKWEADILGFSGNESMSSLASTDIEIIDGTGGKCGHDYRVQTEKVSFSAIQNQTPKSQPDSTVNHEILHKHLELQSDFSDGPQNRNGQHHVKHRQGDQETFRQDSVSLPNPTRRAETFSKPNDKLKCDDDITLGRTEIGKPHSTDKSSSKISSTTTNAKKRKPEKETAEPFDWDTLRKQVQSTNGIRPRSRGSMDSLDYEALRNADVREISDTIKERGMNNMLAERIKAFLDRVVQDHEKIDLEWLRDAQPDKVKDYLLSIRGLGLKSVECVRLLTLHHLAFPVDTNVGRIAVRLGWVPLQPLPESLQLHLLELYPVLETIQKYLWPRLCKLDQETLYELHYQMITFGKVFCTKREPNCNACPMRAECRHFASAFASARLALPGLEERQIISSAAPISDNKSSDIRINPLQLLSSEDNIEKGIGLTRNSEPFIEEPTTPEPDIEVSERDIEDAFYEDPDEIPIIKLNVEEFTTNLQTFMQEQMEMGEADMSKALVALNPELASIPIPKLKHVSRLRTEHQVYELPDSHPLLIDMDRREPDDPSPYLLAIWTPGETADSVQPPESKCSYQEEGGLCDKQACFSCSSTRESQAQTVRGTILIPCRTAMRGSFPLNGTYFQVNEVFADHESSLNPIDVPRSMLWNLPRRTVFFGTSVSTIFKGLSTEDIQYCFWKGFVCVRGFDRKSRAPRPLKARLHLPASKMAKKNE